MSSVKKSLDSTGPSPVRDFIINSNGHTLITKILIANNGIAAVKEIRSVRQWAYSEFGDERAIQFVVMATGEDLKANAEYIRMADQYVEVPGGSNNNNYANVDLIVDIAERTGVHVWAGWGHASENPKLVDALTKSNIVFIGPTSNAMRTLGDKISSTIVAQTANVPCIAWSGDGITVDAKEGELITSIDDELYQKATVHNAEEGLAVAKRIGFPVMIKASEGGGGKGIRMVNDPEHFESCFVQVQREVAGSPIFVMRMADHSRHLEVQLLADQYGNAISLFGRDCSIQRRHQKIIEEAPIKAASPKMIEIMEKGAVRLAKLVGYQSAGTVEYLYDTEKKKAYFLELNPRLQVEHPTTEMVSGVNLPAAQLQVAMGIPLSCIKDIRILYGLNAGTSDIDFDFKKPISYQIQRKPRPKGHVISCRITAENPDAGFKPNSGKVSELNFRSSNNVWGYFSISSAGGIHEFADSQFGHIFSYGETREQARKNMIMALKEISIRGEFRTTIEYLVRILEMEEYKANKVNTSWMDGLIAHHFNVEKPEQTLSVVCGAVSKAFTKFQENMDEYTSILDKGQMPNQILLSNVIPIEFINSGIKYRLSVFRNGPEDYSVVVNGSTVKVVCRKLADGGILILVDEKSHVVYLKEEPQTTIMTLDSKTVPLEKENDPTKMRSPSPGKLIRYLVNDGDHVNAGDEYAEIEVMKMYMPLAAAESGIVTFTKTPGAVLENGEIIGHLKLDDPSKVKSATPFTGSLNLGPSQVISDKPNHQFRAIYRVISNVLDGYYSQDSLSTVVRQMVEILRNYELPKTELHDVLSSLTGRIPAKLEDFIRDVLDHWNENIEETVQYIQKEIEKYGKSMEDNERSLFEVQMSAFNKVLEKYKDGLKGHERSVFVDLLEKYYDVEHLFSNEPLDEILSHLRHTTYKNNIEEVVRVALSHDKVSNKNKLITILLDVARSNYDGEQWQVAFFPILKRLTGLSSRATIPVTVKARELLIYCQLPTYKERYAQIENQLEKAVTKSSDTANATHGVNFSLLSDLIEANYDILDVIPNFFYHSDPKIRMASLYTYIMYTYMHAYEVTDINTHSNDHDKDQVFVKWSFNVRRHFAMANMGHSRRSSATLSSSSGVLGNVIPENVAVEKFDTKDNTDGDNTTTNTNSDANNTNNKDNDNTNTNNNDNDNDNDNNVNVSGSGRKSSKYDDIQRIMSVSDISTINPLSSKNTNTLGSLREVSEKLPKRNGIIVAFNNTKEVATRLPELIKRLGNNNEDEEDDEDEGLHFGSDNHNKKLKPEEFYNVVNIVFRGSDVNDSNVDNNDDDAVSRRIYDIIQENKSILENAFIRRITFLIVRKEDTPHYYTFKAASGYKEDQVIRHMEPALAYQLELNRLSNFNVEPMPMYNNNIHIYHAIAKENSTDSRFFVRALVHPSQIVSTVTTHDFLVSEGDRVVKDIIDSLEVASSVHTTTDCNHLFINFIPTFVLSVEEVAYALAEFIERHGMKLWHLRVTMGDIRLMIQSKNKKTPTPMRFLVNNVSGYITKIEIYEEVTNKEGITVYRTAIGDIPGSLHLQPINIPYSTKEAVQPKRNKAHLMGTTYVYDFPDLFQLALQQIWQIYIKRHPDQKMPTHFMKQTELILNENEELVETDRTPGSNTCGMVAWRLDCQTPEYPEGRSIIVIANDITYKIGSFGTEEDMVYYKASQLARSLGIPRIYISANSGARIGLATELQKVFKIQWIDPNDESKGFDYIYLTEEDYKNNISDGNPSGVYEKIVVDGEVRYKINDVIGKEHGLGTENLQGSGLIAGETSAAYKDIFTATLVTCRSVGIGAYLVRLGQRTVQVEGQPIILTGAVALNKVLGRNVYTSNLQLGGTQIMFRNGISHLTANNDLHGIRQLMDWLAYVPKTNTSPLPIVEPLDPIDRDVSVIIPKGAYDPRILIAGEYKSLNQENDNLSVNGSNNGAAAVSVTTPVTPESAMTLPTLTPRNTGWISGLFDRDSFVESMGGWAQGVVTGRARLGGIPLGVIAVETRMIEQVLPADPGNADSREQTILEAGQVWTPESAFKTSQAINDFNNGEHLPLMILANWRGFSGGQSDLLKGILKYGSYIVDSLREYKQPVFIYVIGELRGGAWVVLDPKINPEMMEMYAESNARGGVLEPEGLCSIKYRKKHILDTIDRLDTKYHDMKMTLKSLQSKAEENKEEISKIQARFEQREKELIPLYHQVAVHFADMHDTPRRLKAKDCINDEIPWNKARKYFYHRLSRRLAEEEVINQILKADPELKRESAKQYIIGWWLADHQKDLANISKEKYDEVMAKWLKSDPKIQQRINIISSDYNSKQILKQIKKDKKSVIIGLKKYLRNLDEDTKKALLEEFLK
ncbi:acetyl-CoA carboxylase [Anaeromyces robustus]|uniref:Acetyl-CoA carboxylase n=1 Tax=Anaeromyces robustus TaxID=1754192 RepID=A0A1Y1XK20_9FUNG|nr:acetyl-CoA carboxylase [Anaeromyces robustus]|eukprot:ORX86109.1 acetyl-CoA carboxylase [Anaeromyces robustus]